ncbi:SNARE-associated protein Snapin [Nibea albiflora]|uniref:SNARE-associated protein Snapin n=1 Tax=Nibea albiflora TaxID=240163 RepID=A0ACB7ERY6_NIBAL|nr:SNARE-associated protein Snapin [Nibea albiflora]
MRKVWIALSKRLAEPGVHHWEEVTNACRRASEDNFVGKDLKLTWAALLDLLSVLFSLNSNEVLGASSIADFYRSSPKPSRPAALDCVSKLCRINEHQKVALDLDPYVKKLLNARRRVVLVNNILQNAQERLRRLNHNVAKETARRKTMLEASGVFTTRSPSKP